MPLSNGFLRLYTWHGRRNRTFLAYSILWAHVDISCQSLYPAHVWGGVLSADTAVDHTIGEHLDHPDRYIAQLIYCIAGVSLSALDGIH